MKFNDIFDRWKAFVSDMNTKGVPVPTARDPLTKQGSVTFSLVCVSAGLCGIAVLFMLASAVAKLAGALVINAETTAQIKSAFDCAFQFLIAALSAYVGRKFQRDSKGNMVVEADPKNDPPAAN